MSWQSIKLGEVVEVAAGQAAPPKDEFEAAGTPFIRAGSVEGLLTRANWPELEHLSDKTAKKRGMKLFPQNTVLFAKSGMSATLGRVFKTDRPAFVVSHLAALKPTGRADPSFLAHWLSYVGTNRLIQDPAYPSIRLADIQEMPFPDIALPEQQRIAAMLDHANTLRRLRRQSLSRLSDLGQAIFFDMFGDLRNSVGHWEEHPLGKLSDVVRGSSPRPQGDPRYFGGPIPRLMIADITRDGMKVMPSIDSLTVEGAKKSRPMKRGEVVMAVSGAIGLPAILSIDACIHDGFVGFRSLSSKITPEFLFHFLQVRRNKNSSQGTGAIWKNLTTDQVKALDIACPPMELQEEFKLRMETLEGETSKARQGSKVLESLFASLQYRAFRGDL